MTSAYMLDSRGQVQVFRNAPSFSYFLGPVQLPSFLDLRGRGRCREREKERGENDGWNVLNEVLSSRVAGCVRVMIENSGDIENCSIYQDTLQYTVIH